MKITGIIMFLIFTVSCSNKQMTLEQYANHPVKFAKQKVNYPNNDFTLFIPKDWFWKVEQYENENIILGIDASSDPNEDGFTDFISIKKLKSFVNKEDIKSEVEYWLNLSKINSESEKIIESGEINLFTQKAYFVHIKSDTGTYGEREIITFILESGPKGIFYYLTAAPSHTKNLKKNMAILIQSLMTFKPNYKP